MATPVEDIRDVAAGLVTLSNTLRRSRSPRMKAAARDATGLAAQLLGAANTLQSAEIPVAA